MFMYREKYYFEKQSSRSQIKGEISFCSNKKFNNNNKKDKPKQAQISFWVRLSNI